MNVNTHIANAIIEADNKSSYDENSINLLSNIYVLANIIQGTLHECKDMSINDIISIIQGKPQIKCVNVHPGESHETITGDRNEDKVPGEGRTTFDIRFHINLPDQKKHIKIIINVEAFLSMLSTLLSDSIKPAEKMEKISLKTAFLMN